MDCSPKRSYRGYTPELRAKAIALGRKHGFEATARTLGIPSRTIYRWSNEALGDPDTQAEDSALLAPSDALIVATHKAEKPPVAQPTFTSEFSDEEKLTIVCRAELEGFNKVASALQIAPWTIYRWRAEFSTTTDLFSTAAKAYLDCQALAKLQEINYKPLSEIAQAAQTSIPTISRYLTSSVPIKTLASRIALIANLYQIIPEVITVQDPPPRRRSRRRPADSG